MGLSRHNPLPRLDDRAACSGGRAGLPPRRPVSPWRTGMVPLLRPRNRAEDRATRLAQSALSGPGRDAPLPDALGPARADRVAPALQDGVAPATALAEAVTGLCGISAIVRMQDARPGSRDELLAIHDPPGPRGPDGGGVA